MGVRSRSSVPTASNQYGLSISTTSVSLTLVRVAMAAEIYVRTASIVFKKDSGTPTATEGFQADPGDYIPLNSRSELDGFRAVRQGGTDATVDVVYFTDVSG